MIKLLNNDKQALHLLTKVKDYYIESEIETAEKLIHFLLPKNDPAFADLEQERYLQTREDLFLIKEINYKTEGYAEVFGKLAIDELKSKVHRQYDSTQKHISFLLDEVLVSTSWTYELHDIPSKLRTVRQEDKTAYGIILSAMNTYGYELEFDTLDKTVHVYQSIGTDKGSYVHSDLNLKKMEFQSDTYDLRTRLYAFGKDDVTFASINGGKAYVENNSFSNKILETVWKDERYTDKQSLLADAQARLDKIAKPRLSYTVDVIQLTDLNPVYKILDYKLGDSVKIIDNENKIIDTQRVMKFTHYPITPERNKIELANSKLVFKSDEEQIKEVASEEANKVRTDLMEEIERTNALIGGPDKGYIITRKNEDGDVYEQLIMDTPDIETASKIWRWNINGLGFSANGYNGDYRVAITNDGKINADFITTGNLDAQIIKSGLLKSQNGKTWIDMNNGTFNFADKVTFDGTNFDIKLTSGKTIEQEIEAASVVLETLIESKASQADIDTASNYLQGLIAEKPTTEDLLLIKQEAIDAAGVEATSLADAARVAAEEVAVAEAELAKQAAINDAQGKFDAESQARVDQAATTLAEAIAEAQTLSNAAENAAKLYAEEQAALASIAKQDTAPDNPQEDMLWMDTSVTPSTLNIYKDGVWEETGVDLTGINDAIGDVYESLLSEINTTQTSINLTVEEKITDATDRILTATRTELQVERDNVNIAITDTNDRLNHVNDDMEEIHSHFTFDNTGLTIGKSDNPLNIVISNTEMQFKDGEKKIAWINGQNMYIDELTIENMLKVGVHQIKKYDANTTLVEYIGED